MTPPQNERDEELATAVRPEAKEPPLYKVLLNNDDFTTMEFVVLILEQVFNRSSDDAMRIMLLVHTTGMGVAGTYTWEVAEMKVARTTALARANEYPLLCTIEVA
ncbi:MAG: ATP-dependent Clp protease adaptor ClpS [Acidobacteriota bacterium]